jgi:hypothetical protein
MIQLGKTMPPKKRARRFYYLHADAPLRRGDEYVELVMEWKADSYLVGVLPIPLKYKPRGPT